MIMGAHLLLYTKKPQADRAFFRNVLRFPAVDAGQGWLIFKLPPAEAAFHPSDGSYRQQLPARRYFLAAELYLMCDNLRAQIKRLQAKKVRCSPVVEAPWGIKTTIRLPSGGEIGLYQPRHPTALQLRSR
jgi:hypothetical protein